MRMLVAWFLSLALASGIVGATITLLVTEHRFELEAVASILVAVATLWLAITTSQSVSATQDILANDRATHSVDNTIDLIHRYMEVSIPATSTISLTPNIAASQVLMFSKATEKTRQLKAVYNDESNDAASEQYRALLASFSILLNYYTTAKQLLANGHLDYPIFMNRFAKTFAWTYDAMLSLNVEVEAVTVEQIETLRPFREASQAWLDRPKSGETT